MLITFLLGLAAGFGAPYAEEYVKSAAESVLLSDAPLSDTELRVFTFALLLLAASLLSLIIGSGGGFALALGAAIGVAGPRIIERIQNRRAPDYSDDDS